MIISNYLRGLVRNVCKNRASLLVAILVREASVFFRHVVVILPRRFGSIDVNIPGRALLQPGYVPRSERRWNIKS